MKKPMLFLLCAIMLFTFSGCFLENDPPDNNGDDGENEVEGFLPMGMNISSTGYYHSRNLMFNDVMKTKHKIGTASYWQGGYTGELDEQGYPIEVVPVSGGMWNPNAPVILINDIYSGDYVFLYDGEGEVEFAEGIEVVSSQPNKIYLKLTECVQTSSNDPHRRVVIKSSVKGNNIRNMRMIPVEYENKESQMPLFRKDFLDGLKGMHVLRFMDAQSTNSTKQVHWTDRPLVSDWAYDVEGLPLEILIELANTLNVDAWFCVPHKASDDYIQKMAALIKSKLNSKLKCYIEYSNEIWHTGFPQGNWINSASDSVDEYIKSDLAALKSPKYGNDNRHLKNAYFMARTFRIFGEQFSGASRDRLVKVGTYYFWEYPREIMQYLIDQDQRPDAMAGKGYFSFNETQHNQWLQNPSAVTALDILDAVLEIWDDEVAPSVISFAEMVHEFEIDYIVYEGGQHMQPFNQKVWDYNQAVYDAQIHEKMYELYMKNFQLHAELDCKLFANFSYVSKRQSQYGSWGALENLSDIYAENLMQIAPKYKAILDANK